MMRRADAPLAQFATTTSNTAEAPWRLLRADGEKPPGSGWGAIPGGKHGGFRRHHGQEWEYWYPGTSPNTKRTGLVGVDQAQIRRVVDDWLDQQQWSRRGILQGDVQHTHTTISATTHDGRPIDIELLISGDPGVRTPSGTAGRYIISTPPSKRQTHAVIVDVVPKPWDREDLARQVRSTLSHELTHAADPGIAVPASRRAGQPQAASRSTVGMAMKPYLNKPTEITARLQQTWRELADRQTMQWAVKDRPTAQQLLAASPTWRAIEEHLDPPGRRRFLRMVALLHERIMAGRVDETFEASLRGHDLLARAEQLSLFGSRTGGAKPPGAGWEPIPHGRHGGFRRRHGTDYEYWYPDKGQVAAPHPHDAPSTAPAGTGAVGTMTRTDFPVNLPKEGPSNVAYRERLAWLRLAGNQLREAGYLWGTVQEQPHLRLLTDLAPPQGHPGWYFVPQVQLVWWYRSGTDGDENRVAEEALRRLGAEPVALDAEPGKEPPQERVYRLPKALTNHAGAEAAADVFRAVRDAAGIETRHTAARQAAEAEGQRRHAERAARIRALTPGAAVSVQMSTLAWAPIAGLATFIGVADDNQSAWIWSKMGKRQSGLYRVPIERVGVRAELPDDPKTANRVRAKYTNVFGPMAKANQTPQLRGLLLRADALPPDDEWFERAMQQLGLFEWSPKPMPMVHPVAVHATVAAKPPGSGWELIPKGRHGGYRRRHGTGWEYWYPEGVTLQSKPHREEAQAPAEPGLVIEIAEPRKEDVTGAMSAERTKGQRKRANDEALKIVMAARAGGRGLTDEEAVKVAAYTGKGGISGDLNQFYTRTDIAAAMWQVLTAYQGDAKKVLEPSCGSGVFLQTAPVGVQVTGVELDDQAAAVAETLHAHKGHVVESKAFEVFTIERSGTPPGFDAVIGNPPYVTRTGDIPLHKPEFRSADHYFIDTSLDHIKDGGVAVLLIHGGVLSNGNPSGRDFRERLAARAEVLDAFRLPNTTFSHVHCEIGADILVLRKRDSTVGGALLQAKKNDALKPTLTDLGAWDQQFIDGDYFDAYPDRILGKALSADETGWRATVEGDAAKVPAALQRMTKQRAGHVQVAAHPPRVRQVGNLFVVEVYSHVTSGYIPQGEHRSLAIAQDDLQSFRADHPAAPAAAKPVDLADLVGIAQKHPLFTDYIKQAVAEIDRASVPPTIGNVQVFANQRYIYIGEPPKWTLMESVADVSQIIERSGDAAIKQAHKLAENLEQLIQARDAGDFYKARAIRRRTAEQVKAWVTENGIPGSHRALGALSKSAPQLLAFIACVDSNGELSDVLAKDAAITLKPAEVDRADLLNVAGHVARRNRGYVNLDDVQHNWEGWEGGDDARRRLLASGQYALDGAQIQHLEDYLTGNLYEKLDAEVARKKQARGEERAQLDRQIKALRDRLETRRRSIDDVPIQLRVMGWLPLDWFNRWLNSPEGRKAVFWDREIKAKLTYDQGLYTLETRNEVGKVQRTSDSHNWLKYLNRLSLKKEHAKDVEDHVERAFDEWIKASDLRADLEDLYNRTFNAEFRREYSGDELGLEGIRKGIVPHGFQNQAVRWAAETGRGILGQDVGLGKTFIAILLARLRKQQGLARRPMVVVPKSVATNWAEEAETLFPGSRVLIIGEHRVQSREAKRKAETEAKAQGLSGEALTAYVERNSWATAADDDMERNRKLAMMRQNEYDLIICTKPAFERIPLKHDTIERFEHEDFWYQRAGKVDSIRTGSATQDTMDKRIEKLKASWAADKLQAKFKHTESMVYWEDLGVDTLIADEAHAYKNLYAARSRYGKNPKFLGGSGQSKQARKMQHMAHVVRDRAPSNGVYLLTATPTKNSPLEVFNMLQHVAPEAFRAIGIENSEQFIDRFCKLEDRLVLTPPGKAKREKDGEEDADETQFQDEFEGAGNLEEAQCVVGFTNLKELEGIMDKYMMLQTATDVGLKIPAAEQHLHMVDMTAEQKAVYAAIRAKTQEVDRREDPGAMFRMLDQMKKAAQDLSLYDPNEYPGAWKDSPKYQACADEVYRGAKERGGQIVFVDHNAAHERLKSLLVERGLRPDQIGIINAQVAADSEARQRIGDRFNRGEIKVVIGNTGTMGEGVNLQGMKHAAGTTDIHHLDQPWDPGTLHQRNGRGVRQGNRAEQVNVHTYLAKGSFDGFRHSTLMGKERWLDKLRSGADSIDNDMDGQGVDEVEMLAMLSDNPDEALKMIREKRASAESAWYAKQAQQAVDLYYSYQRKVARAGKLPAGETRDRLAADAERIKRQLLRSELLPVEIKDVLKAGDQRPAAVNTYLAGEGDARRLAARLIRAGDVVESKSAGHGETERLVVETVDLTDRKVAVRQWGEPYRHQIDIDKIAEQGYATTKYTAIDEVKEVLAESLEASYRTPVEAVAHVDAKMLAANQDMIDEAMRAWLAKHGDPDYTRVPVRAPGGGILSVAPSDIGHGAKIVYPWGKDRADIVQAIATGNKGYAWQPWQNAVLQAAQHAYGRGHSAYSGVGLTGKIEQEAQALWAKQQARAA